MKCVRCSVELPLATTQCVSCGAMQNEAAPIADAVEVRARSSSSPLFGLLAALVLVCVAGLGYWHLTQEPTAPAEMPGRPPQTTAGGTSKTAQVLAITEPEHASAMAAASSPSTQDVVPNSPLDLAMKCPTPKDCAILMLEAAEPLQAQVIHAGAARIAGFKQPLPGDNAAARKLNSRGMEKLDTGHVAEAIDLLGKAVSVDPLDLEINANLGRALLLANKFNEAGLLLVNALIIDSRRPKSWISIAEFFCAKGNQNSAIRSLLLVHEFSADKAVALKFFEAQALKADMQVMRPIYKVVTLRLSLDRGNP